MLKSVHNSGISGISWMFRVEINNTEFYMYMYIVRSIIFYTRYY